MKTFAMVPTDMIRDRRLNAGIDIAVYSILDFFAGKQGCCYPSISTISKTAGLSRPTVITSLKRLETNGYIVKQTKHLIGKMAYDRNRYTLAFRMQFSKGADQNSKQRGGDTTGTVCSPLTEESSFKIDKDEQSNIVLLEEQCLLSMATIDNVIAAWNDYLVPYNFPCVKKTSPSRERAFQKSLKNEKSRKTLNWWKELFKTLFQSEFFTNKAKEGAPWLTLDWVLKEDNIVKIAEGKYNGPIIKSQKSENYQEQKPQTYKEAREMLERRTQMASSKCSDNVIDVDFRHLKGETK